MQMNAYLLFNGNCEAAFKFYERALGGKIEMVSRYGDSPMAKDKPEWSDKIMHIRLSLDGQIMMGSDGSPDHQETPGGYSMSLNVRDAAKAERVFDALAENGNVKMPMQQTFWAERFGMLTDQFGVPWMVNCEKAA